MASLRRLGRHLEMVTKVAAAILIAVLVAAPMGATVCDACCSRDEAATVLNPPSCCGDCRDTVDRQPPQASSAASSTLDHLPHVALLARAPAQGTLDRKVHPFHDVSRRLGPAPGTAPAPLRL
jgi:hypothetical protein